MFKQQVEEFTDNQNNSKGRQTYKNGDSSHHILVSKKSCGGGYMNRFLFLFPYN